MENTSSLSPPCELRQGGLTVAEAARELGYAEGTLRNKINAGEVKVQKTGNWLRVFRDENADLWKERHALGFAETPDEVAA